MKPTSRPATLLRLTCATCAVMTTAAIGLLIHSLARGYDVAAEHQIAARPVVVAQALPR